MRSMLVLSLVVLPFPAFAAEPVKKLPITHQPTLDSRVRGSGAAPSWSSIR